MGANSKQMQTQSADRSGGGKVPSISKLLGSVPTLPGESVERYQNSLQALIDELQATSVLQVYVAEKIHECLWWIHRYEEQKRALIIAEMAALTNGHFSTQVTQKQAYVRDMLMKNQTSEELLQILAAVRHTPESLRQMAMERKSGFLAKLDGQIALQTKLLAGLQGSYEVAFNRKVHVERLHLQNELLRRDVQAIDVAAQEVPSDGQRSTARRQSI